MNGLNKAGALRTIRASAVVTAFVICAFTAGRLMAQGSTPKPWVAPDSARGLKNPVAATPENLTAGAKTFKDNCRICHGDAGKGDGIGGSGLATKPANFTDEKLMALETDGSLFWKMSEGRDPMPTWKDVLTETERWQLVNYIRKLNKDANAK